MQAQEEEAPVRRRSLSPSRAADFLACPLRYRFRVVDKLPEPVSAAAVRGTLVHAVLEHLFDLPPTERDLPAAVRLLEPCWAEQREQDPGAADLVADDTETALLLRSCEDLLATWFAMEDPTELEPRERELWLEHEVGDDLVLRGVVDRLDVAPDGRTRVVDYKTGRSPGEAYERRALFQVKFYALLLWRTTGTVPTELALVYLADQQVLRYQPDELELQLFERTVLAVAEALRTAHQTGRFEPRPSALCGSCPHRTLCPAVGGHLPLAVLPARVRDERV